MTTYTQHLNQAAPLHAGPPGPLVIGILLALMGLPLLLGGLSVG
jgi:hypothetical protein